MTRLIQKYLYPHHLTVLPLEHKWDGFKCGFVISSSDSIEKVARWYDETFPRVNASEQEDYRIYSFDAGDLHLAKAGDTSGLHAFIASTVLKDISDRQHEGVIGVLRFLDYHWKMAPEGPLEGKVIA